MATIVNIDANDQVSTSRADINTNFANLNSDKIETSAIDTDTSLAANSDSKIPSQKAVKTYIDTQGGANASETVRGIVEEATDAEVTAGTSTGATGAKLFVSAAKLATRLTALLAGYQPTMTYASGSATKDLTDTTGATQTIAHGLGRTPKLVRIKTVAYSTSSGYIAEGTWRSSSYASSWFNVGTAADAGETSTSYIIKLSEIAQTSRFQTATVAVDATNITLTWTKTSTPSGNITFLWEAES